MPRYLTRLVWILFALSLGGLVWRGGPVSSESSLLLVDGLTRVMAVLITFMSGIVHSFSRRYMDGSRDLQRFYVRLFGLTLVVLALAAANHLVLFAVLWTAMGWLLADLIGYVKGWPHAQAASRYAKRMFFIGSALLAVALGLLALQTGAWTLREALASLDALSPLVLGGVAVLVLVAAMIQSALVPFHRWLLSSMTAPTPVSAFMHAGLVNAGGLLLARFAPVLFEHSLVVSLVVLAGGVSALLGQAWMLVQTDVKRQLACSTVAQMGFMILQVGLGFIPAAIAHLILHGFYKAYFFLNAGSVVAHKKPEAADAGSSWLNGGVALASGVVGGVWFAVLTGKSITALDSGTVLTAFIVLAVLHATQTALRHTSLAGLTRVLATPVVLLSAISLYAGIYSGLSRLLADLPMAVAPTTLTPLHSVLLVLFVGAYVALQRGWHRASTRLYVTLLNTSRPLPDTLLTNHKQYHVH
mgnify:CR=1 FL=1